MPWQPSLIKRPFAMLGVGKVLTYAAAPRSLHKFVAEFRRIFHPAEHSLPLSSPG